VAVPGLAQWRQELLGSLGAPSTPGNLQFLDAWSKAEGGGATNNPFNTTLGGVKGASSYNPVGVQNYPTPQAGIQATLDTLRNGRYGGIVGALKQGGDPMAAAKALTASPWGTGSLVEKVLGGSPAPASTRPSATPASALALGNLASPSLSVPTRMPLPSWTPPDYSSAILASLGKGAGALTSALVSVGAKAPTMTPTPIAQAQRPAKQATTAAGTPVEIEGAATPRALQAVKLAEGFMGTPYVWGGSNPKTGFDCSGLLQWVWGQKGVEIPRTTYDQWTAGKQVSTPRLQPGDAVFFTGADPVNGKPGHVGMYIGAGKFLEAPHTGADVRVSNLAGRSDFVGARRYG